MLLTDLHNNPFVFFRGVKSKQEKPNIISGRFFTNSLAEAKGHGAYTYSCHLSIESPLIIDAFNSDFLFSQYGHIPINKCYIYPETFRSILLKYQERFDVSDISADNILEVAKKSKKFDSIIIKNIIEGITDIPVYDVIVLNSNCVQDWHLIDIDNDCYKEWVYKRLNLSQYIEEREYDGFAKILDFHDYRVEYKFEDSNSTESALERIVVIPTTECITITQGEGYFKKVIIPNSNHYTFCQLDSNPNPFFPINGEVRIVDLYQTIDLSKRIIIRKFN